jgi:HEAT repeat protein
MPVTQPVPISKLIEALLDTHSPFSPRYLNRLSDLDGGDIAEFAGAWPKVTVQRRQALLEDLEEIHLADDLQNFEAVARIALNDEDPGVRMRAISLLREYELVDLMPRFVDMSEYDPDASVRAGAAAALATFVYLGEVEEISHSKLVRVEECLLRRIASKDDKLIRRRALEALGFSSRQEVVDLINKAYTSGDVEWLVSALFAMGRSANSHWKPQVLKMLNHTQPGVRAEAASAAGELEIRSAKPVLLDMLEDSDIDVRLAAIWALSQVGGSGVREALELYLESIDDSEEADQINNALENLEFTEEMREISLLEISEDGNDSYDPSEDELDEDIDDLISEDGKD